MLRSLHTKHGKSLSRSILGFLVLSILLSGCAGKKTAPAQAEYDGSVLEAKLEAGRTAADPVEAYAWELISQAVEEWNGYREDFHVINAAILGLDVLASYDDLAADGTVQVWSLDYRLSPNNPYLVPDVNGSVLDEERCITNSSYLGAKSPVTFVSDGKTQVLGFLYTKDKDPAVLLRSLYGFLQEQGISFFYQVDPAAFTGWRALYWSFYQNNLAAYQDQITGLGLYRLAQSAIPALTVYSASPSGDSCEIYLIEDGEVRCFTGPSRLAAAADPDGPPLLLAPASVHALGDLSQMSPENREQYEPAEYADCIGQYPPPEDWSQGAFFQELRLAEYTVAEAPQYVLLNILAELPIYVEYLQSEFYFAPDGYLYAKGGSGVGLYDEPFWDPDFFRAYYAQISLHLFITGSLRTRMLALPGLNPENTVTPEQYAADLAALEAEQGELYNANRDFGLLAKEGTGAYRVLDREDYGLLCPGDPASSLLALLDWKGGATDTGAAD